jgi:signal transduction histidine kinase
LERVQRLVHHSARKQNTALDLVVDEGLPAVLGDANQLEQVALNLVMNALQALATGGGRIEMRTRAGLHGGHDGIWLSVIDDGPGIEPDALGRIFHPFFTTKQNGTGLGLAVCQRIVEEHHGHLTARNGEERGAAFEVWLPVPPPEAPNP